MNKRIHTDNNLIYGYLTYEIRKAFFNVYNELGFGHKEQVYQKALVKELEELGLLVNFGAPRLIIKRLIWTGNLGKSAINQCKS